MLQYKQILNSINICWTTSWMVFFPDIRSRECKVFLRPAHRVSSGGERIPISYVGLAKNSINTNVNEWIKCVSESLWLHSWAITRLKENFIVVFSHINRKHLSQSPGRNCCILSRAWEFFYSSLFSKFLCNDDDENSFTTRWKDFVTENEQKLQFHGFSDI